METPTSDDRAPGRNEPRRGHPARAKRGLPGAGWALIALALLVSCHGASESGTPGASPPPSAPAGPRWVSGYYAGWFWEWYPPAVVDMTAMTHFIFGRYAPGGGTLGGRAPQLVQGAGTGHDP